MRDLNLIIERFARFDDGLLCLLTIEFAANGAKNLYIELTGRDWHDSFGAWKVVRLSLQNVLTYQFSEQRNTTAQVLTNGIHILDEDGLIGLELGDLVDAPDSLSMLERSSLFAIGRSLSIEVLGT